MERSESQRFSKEQHDELLDIFWLSMQWFIGTGAGSREGALARSLKVFGCVTINYGVQLCETDFINMIFK
jgi:hypothetical protein